MLVQIVIMIVANLKNSDIRILLETVNGLKKTSRKFNKGKPYTTILMMQKEVFSVEMQHHPKEISKTFYEHQKMNPIADVNEYNRFLPSTKTVYVSSYQVMNSLYSADGTPTRIPCGISTLLSFIWQWKQSQSTPSRKTKGNQT